MMNPRLPKRGVPCPSSARAGPANVTAASAAPRTIVVRVMARGPARRVPAKGRPRLDPSQRGPTLAPRDRRERVRPAHGLRAPAPRPAVPPAGSRRVLLAPRRTARGLLGALVVRSLLAAL